MSNTITNVLPTLLAQGAMALRQQCIMPRLIRSDLSTLAAMPGNVINVPIPSAISAADVTPAEVYDSVTGFAPTVAVVTLDFWKKSEFQMSDSDVESCMDGIIPMQASEAIKALGNAIDSYILGKHLGLYGYYGTPGTTPFSAGTLTAAAQARMLLNKQLAPVGDRRGVLGPEAEANLGIATAILEAQARGDTAGIIEGTIGRKLGFDWYMDQNVTTYTPGTACVSGWSIAASAAAAVTTLTITNATASGTIKAGDIFTIASQQYVVKSIVTGVVSAASAQIAIYPPLVAAVSAAVLCTALGSAYTVNLAFHRDFAAWASRPLSGIAGVGDFQSVVDPVSGVALRLELARQNKQTLFCYDVLGGANVVRRELGVKILG